MRKGTLLLLGGVVFAAASGPFATGAHAIPAFARKYGLRCTACHEAWPALNDFGRAFRDNGYQMKLGKDEPTTTPPGYWPVSIRVTPHYELDSVSGQTTDQGTKTLRSGSFSDIGMDLLAAGTLAKNVSFLVVPTGFTSRDGVTLESAWVRFDDLLSSTWLNVKAGKHEVDLPRSGHRAWSLTEAGYLIYGYHPPGSASLYDMGENQRGIEYSGHDGSDRTRVSLSVFDVEQSPGSRNALDTPGAYLHATHQWIRDSGGVSAIRIGAFGSFTTWPTSTLTLGGNPIPGTGGDLESASKYGLEGQIWIGPVATPLHLILVAAQGRDSRALIPAATRDGTFDGGFLELGWTPTLSSTVFGRWDRVANARQAVPGTPRDLGDESAYTAGLRHAVHLSDRTAIALHAEYSLRTTSRGADDGSDRTSKSLFLGADLAF